MKLKVIGTFVAVVALMAAVGSNDAGADPNDADFAINGSFDTSIAGWQPTSPYSAFDPDVDRFNEDSSGSVYFELIELGPHAAAIEQCLRMAPDMLLQVQAWALIPAFGQPLGSRAQLAVQYFSGESCQGAPISGEVAQVSPTIGWQELFVGSVTPPGTGSGIVRTAIVKNDETAIATYGHIDEITVVASSDSDFDGCRDGEELMQNPQLGGDRNPISEWDFFDVPVPALLPGDTTGNRNDQVTLADVLAVVAYVGTSQGGPANTNGADYDSDLDFNGIADGQEYDRTPSSDPTKPWRSGPPSGLITLSDALVALQQVGHSCMA